MDLSVVIPTKDRRDTLLHTLDRLAAQTLRAEIVVVDNGSTDGTSEAVAAAHPDVVLLREPKPGPAAARNRGVERAQAPVVLFLGDDMAPAQDTLLAAHAGFHARTDERTGLLGRVTWRPDLEVTPFMHWLENGGPQFDFARLPAGEVSPATHFITAQVSVKRSALEPFDERFTGAAVEDAELGLRLARKGVRLHYDPSLLVLHDHPTSVEAGLRRMRGVGASARLFHEIHPTEPTGFPRPRGRWRAYPAAAAAARVAARVPPLRERAWTVLMLDAYAKGYRG